MYFEKGRSANIDGQKNVKKDGTNIVKIYSFGDYIDPKLVSEFENKTGIEVIYDTFDTNEELYPVIKKSSVRYDCIVASDYMIEKLKREKLLAKINYKNVPNIKNIDEEYLNLAKNFDKGNEYAIPHTFGTMGIIYNTKKIKKGSINSWKDLWKEKYKRQIVMPDTLRDLLGIGLKVNGYSINSTNKEELQKAVDSLRKQKPLVYKYANDSARDMVIGGATDIAIIWSGEVLYSKEENPDLEYVIPKEGTEEFMDLWAIPKRAQNKENAEKWMNFMLEKKNALKNFDYLTYAIPNKAVIDEVGLKEEDKNVLFPNKKLLEKCEFLKYKSQKDEELYSRYWKKFKTW